MVSKTEDRNFVYCCHYKKLLVEDFSLNDNRENLHYGKCAVIGYCTVDRGVYSLGNVRITSMNPNVQLFDNAHRVLLLPNGSKEGPPIDNFVEVFGESVLLHKTVPFSCDISSIPCTTSLDLFKTRCAAEETNGELDDDYHSIVTDTYIPAIKVHGIVSLDNAHEIINCNLRLKLVKGR